MKKKQIFLLGLLVYILCLNVVMAETSPIDDEIDPEDRERFDQILQPVMKIYNFVKYISSVIAGIFLLYAGICYMTSGSDPKKRDQAKNIAAYVVIGLIIIWGAPIIVSLLV
nr:hypothetical protein [Nanoarchaeum sp.]